MRLIYEVNTIGCLKDMNWFPNDDDQYDPFQHLSHVTDMMESLFQGAVSTDVLNPLSLIPTDKDNGQGIADKNGPENPASLRESLLLPNYRQHNHKQQHQLEEQDAFESTRLDEENDATKVLDGLIDDLYHCSRLPETGNRSQDSSLSYIKTYSTSTQFRFLPDGVSRLELSNADKG
jgi:hypothetical protein